MTTDLRAPEYYEHEDTCAALDDHDCDCGASAGMRCICGERNRCDACISKLIDYADYLRHAAKEG